MEINDVNRGIGMMGLVALGYAKQGIPVFPLHIPTGDGACSCGAGCVSIGKHPRTEHGHKDATTDEQKICDYWRRWPEANIGIPMGQASGLIAIDVDPRNGGCESLAELVQAFGELPPTTDVATGGGGKHFIYRNPGTELRGKLARGIDVKADGGYIVAPPSLHQSGKRYEWIRAFDEKAPEPMPEWLLQMLEKKAPQKVSKSLAALPDEWGGERELAASVRLVASAPEGDRNNTLNAQAFLMGKFVAAGSLPRDMVEQRLLAAALQAGLGDDETARTIKSALDAGEQAHQDKPAYAMSQGGNARRLVDRHGEDLRYAKGMGWLTWDGKRWERDDGKLHRLGKKISEELFQESDDAAAEDEKLAKALKQFAKSSDTASSIEGMNKMASSDLRIRCKAEAFDRDPFLLNILNGTLDLATGQLLPHERGHLITKLAPVSYDPDATCPTWEGFLDRIMGGDQELIAFLQRAVGYSLTGSTQEQVFFVCYGNGRNGKSVFTDTLATMLGEYATETPTETLMAKKNGSNSVPTDLARLAGIRLVGANETEDGQRLAEAKIKQMTGGDKITARFMRQDFFEFMPEFKLWLRTNHRPVIRGTDNGIWRRIKLIPFTVTIPEEEVDAKLPAKLRAELPGILAWAVQGCLAWKKTGLKTPQVVDAATKEYRADMDCIGRFMESVERRKYKAGDLFVEYQTWCRDNAELELSQTAFGRYLTEMGWATQKGTSGKDKGIIFRVPPPNTNDRETGGGLTVGDSFSSSSRENQTPEPEVRPGKLIEAEKWFIKSNDKKNVKPSTIHQDREDDDPEICF